MLAELAVVVGLVAITTAMTWLAVAILSPRPEPLDEDLRNN